jgi:hypothetical protein
MSAVCAECCHGTRVDLVSCTRVNRQERSELSNQYEPLIESMVAQESLRVLDFIYEQPITQLATARAPRNTIR